MKCIHTHYSYLMFFLTLAAGIFFAWIYYTAAQEPPSRDSGPNLAVTTVMVLIVLFLASFISLSVGIDELFLRIKFGYGLYAKKIPLIAISSVKTVQNHWYRGWGIRILSRPRLWLHSVSCSKAVEIALKNGKTYKIGTKKPEVLTNDIRQAIR